MGDHGGGAVRSVHVRVAHSSGPSASPRSESEVVAISQDLTRGVHQIRHDKSGEVGADLFNCTIDEVTLFLGRPHLESLIPCSNELVLSLLSPFLRPLYGQLHSQSRRICNPMRTEHPRVKRPSANSMMPVLDENHHVHPNCSRCIRFLALQANLEHHVGDSRDEELLERVKGPFSPALRTPHDSLGIWYATAVFWRPQVAFFRQQRTLLPLLVSLAPAAPLGAFPRESS